VLAIPCFQRRESVCQANRLPRYESGLSARLQRFVTREMSETVSSEFIGRRLDGVQNNVSGVNRRMITLENTLSDRMMALEARLAGLEDRTDQLVDRLRALETGVNCLILLIEQVAKA
jgi:hypothetical protein